MRTYGSHFLLTSQNSMHNRPCAIPRLGWLDRLIVEILHPTAITVVSCFGACHGQPSISKAIGRLFYAAPTIIFRFCFVRKDPIKQRDWLIAYRDCGTLLSIRKVPVDHWEILGPVMRNNLRQAQAGQASPRMITAHILKRWVCPAKKA